MDRMSPIHEEILRVLREKEASYASPICSEVLGEKLNLTPSYVREQVRLLQELRLVGVRRGRGGGYFLLNGQEPPSPRRRRRIVTYWRAPSTRT
ncbi:MAG: AsnC family transcriptional regulator [Bacillota bacterium]|nr:AsnC family transcriptional regulator [Bacillota bacterium]